MVLETLRLRLECWQPDDWRRFQPIATDSEVMRYITDGRPWTEEEIRAFVDKQLVRFVQDRFCRWKLMLKETEKLVGFCGLGILDGFEEPEIGWWLARNCWGFGLASEAAAEALRDARERLQLARVISVARPANQASIRVMEKIGLRFEREAEQRGVPVVVYAL